MSISSQPGNPVLQQKFPLRRINPVPAPVTVQVLDDKYFSGMRNEFTSERFELLREFVTRIKNPGLYGTYEDEKHFLDTYDFFLMSTDETRHRGFFLLREIIARQGLCARMLDVGPGSGLITKWIGNRFDEVTVVDPNAEAIKSISAGKIRKRTRLRAIHGQIEDVILENDYYDLGLLSHVFYYLDYSRWLEVTQQVYDSVRLHGKVVVVLNGDQYGKANMIRWFRGKSINIEPFIAGCSYLFPNSDVRVFTSVEYARAPTLDAMLHIAGFFLYDVGATATREQLVDYVEQFHRNRNGTYSMRFMQKFIVISRK